MQILYKFNYNKILTQKIIYTKNQANYIGIFQKNEI